MICRERSRGLIRRAGASLTVAAIGAALVCPAQALADDFDVLRGSLSSPRHMRWEGVNFGGQFGLTNMHTDFGGSTSSEIAYILRDSTLENEAAPSNWTTLPANSTNGRSYGIFLGYNLQWDDLVIGFDGTYTRAGSLQSSASDGLTRVVTTSDSVQHTVTINAQSSMKLIDYATFRVRAGYAFGQFLPYAFVGGAAGRFNYTSSATVTDVQDNGGVITTFGPQTQSNNKNNAIDGGFTLGLGLDVAVLPNVFLRAEWEFVGFAQVNGIRSTINTGRIGIGVKF